MTPLLLPSAAARAWLARRRWTRALGAGCAAAALLCAGCAADASTLDVTATGAPIIYDRDDRSELYAARDPDLTHAALDWSVALLPHSALSREADTLRIQAEPASLVFDLCPDEPFAQQPSAAVCSGVLLAPDLLLTAAHCVRGDSWRELRVVRRFAYADAEHLYTLGEGDVTQLAEVLARVPVTAKAPDAPEYALLRLARPFALASAPAVARAAALRPGDAVTLVGNGAGLPTKLDEHGRVLDPRSERHDYFLAAIDNFAGGSGSAVLDAQGRLLGIAVRGARDFSWSEEGCARARELSASATQEAVIYLDAMLDALCSQHPEVGVCPSSPPPPAATCSLLPRAPGTHWLEPGWMLAGAAWFCRRWLRARHPAERRRRWARACSHGVCCTICTPSGTMLTVCCSSLPRSGKL